MPFNPSIKIGVEFEMWAMFRCVKEKPQQKQPSVDPLA